MGLFRPSRPGERGNLRGVQTGARAGSGEANRWVTVAEAVSRSRIAPGSRGLATGAIRVGGLVRRCGRHSVIACRFGRVLIASG